MSVINELKTFRFTKKWIKNFILMLVSVTTMGFGVSLLKLTHFGTDPCSSMNYGVAGKIGMSFGTYQLLLNLVLLIFVILFNWRLIGTGTIGNMVVVGYAADFFTKIWNDVCHIPADLSMGARIAILIPTLFIFVIAAACYMNSGCGMAPYDAIPFIICSFLEKKFKKDLFKPVRFCLDLAAMLIGWFTGGETGLITVLMVITLAPTVAYVGEFFEKHGIVSARNE
ncbi:MAG: hypothetical protein J1E62_07635 [Lachnospiraceae bacterium]|nr:hypothetical protein [Lachnospiraceae bacterium]